MLSLLLLLIAVAVMVLCAVGVSLILMHDSVIYSHFFLPIGKRHSIAHWLVLPKSGQFNGKISHKIDSYSFLYLYFLHLHFLHLKRKLSFVLFICLCVNMNSTLVSCAPNKNFNTWYVDSEWKLINLSNVTAYLTCSTIHQYLRQSQSWQLIFS